MTPWLFDSALKVTVVLIVALAVTACLRRRSAAARHWILAAAVAASATVPGLTPLLPAWNPGLRIPRVGAATQSTTPLSNPGVGSEPARSTAEPDRAGSETSLPLDLLSSLPLVWLAGSGFSFAVLAIGLVRLRWLASRSRPVRDRRLVTLAADCASSSGLRHPVPLTEGDHPALPATWGALAPRLMIPDTAHDWSDDRARVVFHHEMAHIARRDWAVQLLAEIVRCVYWFNPLIWIVSRRIRQESEQACDDAVLRQGVEAADYAAHLLEVAQRARALGHAWVPAPAMARSSSLERRVGAMFDQRQNRSSLGRRSRSLVVGLALALAAAVSGFDALAQTFSTLSGSVLDPTNRVLPRATLILTNPVNEARYEVRSDATGRFEFVGLPPGTYALEARFPGFTRLNGTVTVSGARMQKDLALEVGSLEETIVIVGGNGARPTPPPPPPPPPGAGASVPPPPPPPPAARPALARRGTDGCIAPATGGNLRPPRKLKDVRPRYPENLIAAGAGGVVVMQAVIDTDGNVSEVSVTSPAQPDFDAAAVEAVRQWQFDATLLNCEPVDVPMKVTATFRYQP